MCDFFFLFFFYGREYLSNAWVWPPRGEYFWGGNFLQLTPPVILIPRRLTGTLTGCVRDAGEKSERTARRVQCRRSQLPWRGGRTAWHKRARTHTPEAADVGNSWSLRDPLAGDSCVFFVFVFSLSLVRGADRWTVTMFRRKTKSTPITDPKTT